MKDLLRTCGTLAFAGSLFATAAHAAPPPAFAACAACHTSDGGTSLGPTLKGVYGRKAGTAAGFRYSPAMKKAATVWDDKSLDSFLADTQKAIPGNVMPFPGVPDAQQRAQIIDYLKAVK